MGFWSRKHVVASLFFLFRITLAGNQHCERKCVFLVLAIPLRCRILVSTKIDL